MAWSTAVAIYFIIWWVVLFAILPFGVRSQEESGEIGRGTDPGAPTAHNVKSKLIWTTVVSLVIFGVCALLYEYRLVTIDGLARFVGFDV